MKRDAQAELENAVAIIIAAIPRDLLIEVADHLDSMATKRTHGGLDFGLNVADGVVRSADFKIRTHWRPSQS